MRWFQDIPHAPNKTGDAMTKSRMMTSPFNLRVQVTLLSLGFVGLKKKKKVET